MRARSPRSLISARRGGHGTRTAARPVPVSVRRGDAGRQTRGRAFDGVALRHLGARWGHGRAAVGVARCPARLCRVCGEGDAGRDLPQSGVYPDQDDDCLVHRRPSGPPRRRVRGPRLRGRTSTWRRWLTARTGSSRASAAARTAQSRRPTTSTSSKLKGASSVPAGSALGAPSSMPTGSSWRRGCARRSHRSTASTRRRTTPPGPCSICGSCPLT